MLGSRGNVLLSYISYIKQQIGQLKIVKVKKMEEMLKELMPHLASEMAVRIGYASFNPKHYQKEFIFDQKIAK